MKAITMRCSSSDCRLSSGCLSYLLKRSKYSAVVRLTPIGQLCSHYRPASVPTSPAYRKPKKARVQREHQTARRLTVADQPGTNTSTQRA